MALGVGTSVFAVHVINVEQYQDGAIGPRSSWSSRSGAALALRDRRTPGWPRSGCRVLVLKRIGDEPVAEAWVLGVDLVGGVDQVRGRDVSVRDGPCAPLVVRLGASPQHPAGHRDVVTVSGKVADQRVDHVGLTP